MEDNQAVCKVVNAGGSMKLMRLPRTHRIDAAASSGQFTRGVFSYQCERHRIKPLISVPNVLPTLLHG
eukprot:7732686-Pyramimonas_sp.AAC.1